MVFKLIKLKLIYHVLLYFFCFIFFEIIYNYANIMIYISIQIYEFYGFTETNIEYMSKYNHIYLILIICRN